MLNDLWIPTGATYGGIVPVGQDTGNGGVISHELMVEARDKFGKVHKQLIRVLANGNTSQSEVEDMMGYATENFVKEVREKYDKRPATVDERKQAGKAINEFLKHRTKRRASTSNRIYF